MNRKIIAAAVAGALLAPLAAQAEVTIYGSLRGSFEGVSATGADTPAGVNTTAPNVASRTRVQANNSRLGFKGSEDLGNGLKAIWQVEQYIDVDNSTGGTLRNTYVGLASDSMGKVILGRHDTPMKISTSRLDPFIDTAANYNSIIGSVSGNVGSGVSNNSIFDLRASNVLAYITPNLSGFTGAIAYVANESKSADASAAGVATASKLNPNAWSLALMYDNGPLYVSYAYEKHTDLRGKQADDKSHRLGLGYKIADTQLGFIYDRIELEDKLAAGNASYKRNAFQLSAQHQLGNLSLRAAYTKAQKGEYTGGLKDAGASQWTLGAYYDLSKRTQVYGLYTRLDNKGATGTELGTNYNFGNNTAIAQTIGSGANPTALAVGIKHDF